MTVEAREKLKASITQQLMGTVDTLVDAYVKVYDALPAHLEEAQKQSIVNTISNDVTKVLNSSLADMDNIFEAKLNDKSYMDKIVSSIQGDMNE